MPAKRLNRDLDRRHTRALRWGIALSVLLHALLFAVFAGQRIPPAPFAAAGERRGDDRAARGGGMEALELRAPTPTIPEPPPAIPVPTAVPVPIRVPEPEPRIEPVPAIALADAAPGSGAVGPLTGPGLARGEGEGDGGTEAEGRFRVVPPRPRGLILPPADRPESVRGREVEVWVYVSAVGHVVPDSNPRNPATGDRRFDRRLREHAAGWVFEAAKRDGRAVAEWFRYTIIM